jgi:signal transduction histidine kinase
VTTHDLRTPLVNIQGFAKLLKDYLIDLEKQTETMNFPASARQILGEEIPEALTYILAGASKMNALINGLLRISRTGNMELKIEKISITEIIAGIMEVINFQVQEHRVSVQIEELPTCIGDREMISQLFSNIIDNAIKYKKENLPLVIAIKGKVQEQHVLYEVRDNGQGLKKDQVQKVFELFYRFEQKNKVQGEGLGLTLSKKIMDRHHGKIWVESEEGHGCSFFIQFPLVYAQQD